MKKTFLLFIITLAAWCSRAQLHVAKPPVMKFTQTNLLDANPAYRRAPVKFVPFVATEEFKKQGYKADSVYVWKKPDGTTARATGQKILDELNAMEKELCLRGHSLREDDPFANVYVQPKPQPRNTKLPAIAKLGSMPVASAQHTLAPKTIAVKKWTIPANGISRIEMNAMQNEVYLFTRKPTTGEFALAFLGNVLGQDFSKDASFDISLCLASVDKMKLSKVIVEVTRDPDRTPAATDEPLLSATMDAKNISGVFTSKDPNVKDLLKPAPADNTLYTIYPVHVTGFTGNYHFPKPQAYQDDIYYLTIKLIGINGQPIVYTAPQQLAIDNSVNSGVAIQSVKSGGNQIGQFSYSKTDPKGILGLYINSSGMKAIGTVSTLKDQNGVVPPGDEDKNYVESSINCNVEMGAQIYNFVNLLDSKAPVNIQIPLLSFNLADHFKRLGRVAPPIRVNSPNNGPSSITQDQEFTGTYSLRDFSTADGYINGSFASQSGPSQSHTQNLIDQRFFIGPVPIHISVDLTATTGISFSGTHNGGANNGYITSTITPYANITLSGNGGVDAEIAYATVGINVHVIDVKAPITLITNPANYISGTDMGSISSQIQLGGLGGDIHFDAGICVPLIFTRICKNFHITIISWPDISETDKLPYSN